MFRSQVISLYDRNLGDARHSVTSNESARLSKPIIDYLTRRDEAPRPYSL
jgi:hypothetical protein